MRRLIRIIAALPAGLAAGAPALAAGKGEQANPTEEWGHTWTEVLIDLWVIGIVFAVAAVYLLLKYRAKSPDDVGTAKKLSLGTSLAWCFIPVAVFIADDFLLSAKGWSLWNIQRTVPAGAMEIRVTGSQWAFTYEYPNGLEISSSDRDTDADLHSQGVMDGDMVIPVGQPIVLRMTSTDVIHSFGLTAYRLKEDMMPGRITYLWFMAREPNVSHTVCVEFCGTNHSDMFNRVVAVPKAEYDAWLEKKSQESGLHRPSLAAGPTEAVANR
jgi:cytochrome c oxidase subunit 2